MSLIVIEMHAHNALQYVCGIVRILNKRMSLKWEIVGLPVHHYCVTMYEGIAAVLMNDLAFMRIKKESKD